MSATFSKVRDWISDNIHTQPPYTHNAKARCDITIHRKHASCSNLIFHTRYQTEVVLNFGQDLKVYFHISMKINMK